MRDACLAVGDGLASAITDQERRETDRQRADLDVLARQLLRLVHNAPNASDGLRAGVGELRAVVLANKNAPVMR